MKVIIPFESLAGEPSILSQPEITVRDKQGNKVRVVCTDANIPGYPVVGVVECDDPNNNFVATYTKEGRYSLSGGSDYDLVVEVDNDALTKRFGVDPLAAANIASSVFGDPRQYSQEERELISMISLAAAAV